MWSRILTILKNEYINSIFNLELRKLHSSAESDGSEWDKWRALTIACHSWTVSGGATCLYSETGIVACSRMDSTRLNLLRSYVDLIRAMKEDLEDWRDGSVLESPHCFCREPDIQFAACISGGSLAITPPGALMPPSGLHGHQYTSAHICTKTRTSIPII